MCYSLYIATQPEHTMLTIDTQLLREHNAALAAKNLELLDIVRKLSAEINCLALTPADDFYKPGDYASGLVNDLWKLKNDLCQGVLNGHINEVTA